MAVSDSYEFRCPQFVDFCSGVEKGSTNEAFLDSPADRYAILSEYREFKKAQKQQNIIYRSTPINKQLFGRNIRPTNTTDSYKLNARRVLSDHLSKSDESVHLVPSEQSVEDEASFFPIVCRKRSVSESGLRPKKITCPTTPMCLKRTQRHATIKRYKTTEELELEKIAQLQKQTSEHLRANEITMKKLRAGGFQRGVGVKLKARNAPVKTFQNDQNSIMEKVNAYARKVRQVEKESSVVPTERFKKMGQMNNRGACSSNRFLVNNLHRPGPSRFGEANAAIGEAEAIIKTLSIKGPDPHGGLTFYAAQRKTILKPFQVNSIMKNGSEANGNEVRLKDRLSISMCTPQINKNVSPIKFFRPLMKSERPQPGKRD